MSPIELQNFMDVYWVFFDCFWRAASMEDCLDRVSNEEEEEGKRSGLSGSAKKIFGSFEKGIDKMIDLLSPRRRSNAGLDEPRKVKVCHHYIFENDLNWPFVFCIMTHRYFTVYTQITCLHVFHYTTVQKYSYHRLYSTFWLKCL